MPFVPLAQPSSSPLPFPRVSPSEQAERDGEAEQIVRAEFDQDMPDENRTALEREYQQRFGGKSAQAPSGFVPLAQGAGNIPGRGFVPLADDKPSLLKTIALNYPATAIGETALNLGSQMVSLPAAGLSGLATGAGNMLGLTDKAPADVVHSVGDALTYQPRGEVGKAITGAVMLPFEKLAEVGQGAGDRVLDATGSPAAATFVDTAINSLPMLVAPGIKAVKARRAKSAAPVEPAPVIAPEAPEPHLDPADGVFSRAVLSGRAAEEAGKVIAEDARAESARNFQEVGNGQTTAPADGNLVGVPERVSSLEGNENALHESQSIGMEELRRAGNNDLPPMGDELLSVPSGRGTEAIAGIDARTNRQRAGIQSRELPLGDKEGTGGQQADVSLSGSGRAALDAGGYSKDTGNQSGLHEGASQARALDGYRVDAGTLDSPEHPIDYISGENANSSGVVKGVRGNSEIDQQTDSVWRHDGSGIDSIGLENGKTAPASTSQVHASSDIRRQDPARRGVGAGVWAEQEHIIEPTRQGDTAGTGNDTGRLTALDHSAHEAATSHLNDLPHPTDAQIAAGNYTKGTARVHGLDLAIENPRGSVRSGVDKAGRPWRTEMKDHYGYLREKVLGSDGDKLDTFVGPKEQTGKVYIVDQIDPKTKLYDEHKIIFGAETPAEARAIYERNYEPSWRGMGALTEMTPEEFKGWIDSGDTKKPVALDRETPAAGQVVDVLESQQAMAPGASYTGFVGDAAGTEGTRVTDNPIRREDILRPLVKALGAPIYQGRVKGKALGTYAPGRETVRLKKANDLEVASHEFAHLVDDRIPEIRKAYKSNPILQEELRSVSYDKTKIHEGFAEFVRLWATQPEVAKAKAPTAFKWFESFVDSHEYGPALRKAQEGMTSWFAQDALHRAQSKIGVAKDVNASLDGFWDKFRQSVSDDLHGIYKMELDLTGKIAPVGPYETSRLMRASSSITEGAVRYGRPVKKADGSFAFEGHGLEKILEPVADRLNDWLMYAVGRSAHELMTQGRENLFTKAEIKAMLDLKQDGFERQFMLYQAWNNGILDFAEAQGVINPEMRQLWKRNAYLPFHRVGQAGEARSAKPGEWSGVKALTGGTDNIRDVLGNILGNASTLMEKAIQNEARVKVADLADKTRGGGRFMTKIPTDSRPVKIDAQQVANEVLRKLGADPHGPMTPVMAALEREILKAPGFFEFMIGNQSPAGGNVVAVMRGGRKEFYEVGDPILYRALSAFDRPDPSWIVRWLGVPKRIGQMTVTLTPDFAVANIARDTLMGAVMSRAGFRPVMDSIKGMTARLTNDPIYTEFIANGGGLSSILLDEKRMRNHLERFYTSKGINYRTVLDAPDKLLYAVETIADAFEMSTRLGEYKRAVERGEHPRHAAYLGREVSTDFAMRGDDKALGFLYDTVMFLRPAVESMDRLYRGVAHDPNRFGIAAKTGTLAMVSTALYLHNRLNPDYADLADWDKDTNWHFFVGDQHFRWPKIWEIGAVASLAERTAEKTLQADPLGLGKDMLRILGGTFGVNLMPQAIGPIFEQAANRNAFTKAPIETPGMANEQPFLRAKPGTSETLRQAGIATRNMPESIQVNPVRAEALLRGYFNTWALYGLMASDQMLYGDQLPEKRTDQLPVVRRFYEQKPAIHTKHEEVFYDMLGEAARLHGTLRALDKMGRPEMADEKEHDLMAGKAKQFERVQKQIHAIDQDAQAVRNAKGLEPNERRLKLDALQAERNVMMKATVEDVQGELKKAGK
jgi:hypothetical protein